MGDMRELLRQKEADLLERLKEYEPIVRELAEVRLCMRSLDIAPANPHVASPFVVEKPTIKELIREALRAHLSDGARPIELATFFASAWGYNIDRGSIAPQLSRLRGEGVVVRGDNGKWRLRAAGGDGKE